MEPRTIVITGASSGVGRATARAFAAPGMRLALLARGVDALEATRREVEDAGAQALVAQVDVADADAVERAAARVEDELGEIDVWVNNAMTAVLSPLKETSAADFRRVTEVAYLGYVHGTMAALARMLPRDRGVIVQVGSALSYRAIPLQATYCGAKFAIRGFTDSVRCELMHDGSSVRITMVQLPGLDTPQFDAVKTTLRRYPRPVPPVYAPEVAADAVVWAARHPRRELWVGGSTYATILANRLAPALVDRYLARTNVDAQQDDAAPIDPKRPSYLWEPLRGDRGARGRYGEEAHGRSVLTALSKRRRTLVGAGAPVVAAAVASRFRRRRRSLTIPRRRR